MASRKNRRQFLEESMLAAAAMAAAGPADFLLDSPPSSCPPLEQLGVAVIGARGRGNSHLGFFAGRRDTRVLYVCDVDQQVGRARVAQVGKRQRGNPPLWVADLRRVLDDPRVDIVSIATPHHWHALAAIWAMQAGKDVYVEKPVSHNVLEGRRMVETARRHRRVCQAGFQARSNPGMIEAMEFVRSGGIGTVSQARAICYRHRSSAGPREIYSVPRSVDYDLWLGPAAAGPLTRQRFHHDWHWQWAYGNGELGHQGMQPLDLCRWGLGLSTISRCVLSLGGRFASGDAAQTTNTQVTLHDFGDKSIVMETRALPSAPFHAVQVGVIFYGSTGYAAIASQDRGVAYDGDGHELRRFQGGGGSEWHFRNFLQAVRRRSCLELNSDIEEGHVSSALAHTANISYRLGRRVSFAEARVRLTGLPNSGILADTLDRMQLHLHENGVDTVATSLRLGARLTCDPVAEKFLNHSTANQLLTREYRRPFVVPAAGIV
ncbi:MAG: Gfo/Idh/MocA family protein [Pirellulaceae bacterium]